MTTMDDSINDGVALPTIDAGLISEIETVQRFEMILRVIITAIIVPLGTVGNVLAFLVLRRKLLRDSPVNLFLSVLAVVDVAVLYLSCLVSTIAYATGRSLSDLDDAGCKLNWFLNVYSIDLSAWILILVSLERAVAVWFPLRSKRLYGQRHPTYMIIAVFVFLFVKNSPHLFIRGLQDGVCLVYARFSEFDNIFYNYVGLVVYAFFPCSLILICNILVAIKVNGFRQIKKTKATSNTVMMITTTLTFVVLTFPMVIYNIVHYGWYYKPLKERIYLARNFAIWHMLSYTNSAINFILYICTGPRFRREVARLLFKRLHVVHPELSNMQVSQTRELDWTTN